MTSLRRAAGIAAGTRDFEAVAMHELGRVLGFTSTVGLREPSAGAGRLGLGPGFNRVGVVAAGLRPNIVVLEPR